MTHIGVSDQTIIGSDNGLSPGRRQAIIRTNAGILLIRPLGTNFSEILIEIWLFSFKKMRLKVSSVERRPFCLGLNVLIVTAICSQDYFFLRRLAGLGCAALYYITLSSSVIAPGNPTLWRGVPVASIQKSFGSSGRDWKPWKKLPIACKFCTYRFIRYSSTCYGKVRINPLMANTRNPGFFASPVANAAWFVVVRPCYLNRDLLSGPKGN